MSSRSIRSTRAMWDYSLDTLNEEVLPRDRIHHLSLAQSLKTLRPYPSKKLATYLRDVDRDRQRRRRDMELGRWRKQPTYCQKRGHGRRNMRRLRPRACLLGQLCRHCAYAFHRLLDRPIPFSIWLHAGADLYDTPVYLKQKLLYADQIVTCCAFNRKYLAEHYSDIFPAISEKINVCYHGLNFPDFPYTSLDGRQQHKIVAVGRLSKEKGFSYLLERRTNSIARGTEVELEFVGEGEEDGNTESPG